MSFYNSLMVKESKSIPKSGLDEINEDEGQDLCPKCGNLMVQEGGEKVCSSCSDDLDFFGEEDLENQKEN